MTSALETLIELSQERMDEAAKKLGEALASSQAQEQKLELLDQYRNEYIGRFRVSIENGIGPDAWSNYSAFLGKLDAAIEEQQLIVQQAQSNVSAGRQLWVDERNRKKAFDTLAVRQEKIAEKRQFKMEQKATDEYSAKLFRRHAEQ
ncbi:MAG: flagellar export protein FliJ [Betaproteobacteria bacterium]|nr:flagellar export protein FliJ [Betaproteobacteria bacterium]